MAIGLFRYDRIPHSGSPGVARRTHRTVRDGDYGACGVLGPNTRVRFFVELAWSCVWRERELLYMCLTVFNLPDAADDQILGSSQMPDFEVATAFFLAM